MPGTNRQLRRELERKGTIWIWTPKLLRDCRALAAAGDDIVVEDVDRSRPFPDFTLPPIARATLRRRA